MANNAILLLNLGTPSSPEPEDVGSYLSEFLMDPLVINLPWPLRWFLVHVLIVPKRKFASSLLYKKIWKPSGSPLLLHLQNLRIALAPHFRRDNVDIKYAMRYGEPSIRQALVEWVANPPRKILVVPLYPQYAESSTLSSIHAVKKIARALKIKCPVEFFPAFYEDSRFISALAAVTQKSLSFTPDHYLFSYHGLPKAQVMHTDLSKSWCGKNSNCCAEIREENKDCYRAQSFATSRSLAKALGLTPKQWSQSFQSRLGRAEWIKPYTDHWLAELPKTGVKRLAVLCPSFVADCLETLEEIALQGREIFLNAGGEEYQLIPCLNSDPIWAEALAKMLKDALVD